jgi:hypothetical protein
VPVDVAIERGSERVFATAVAWPGWSRAGRNEAAALEALLAAGGRYAAALKGARLGFRAPRALEDLHIVARASGTSTTDFGAPAVAAPGDADTVDGRALRRFEAILRAGWRTFDAAVEAAEGTELTTGPRGGGRSLGKIVDHVVGAEAGYLRLIGATAPPEDVRDRLEATRAAVIAGLERAVREGVPPSPRGGTRWSPRYFVRRSAWHVLDHAWEIEDRTQR